MMIYLASINLVTLFNKVLRRWIEEAEKEGITRLSSQLYTKAITTEFPAMLSFVLVIKQMRKSWLVASVAIQDSTQFNRGSLSESEEPKDGIGRYSINKSRSRIESRGTGDDGIRSNEGKKSTWSTY